MEGLLVECLRVRLPTVMRGLRGRLTTVMCSMKTGSTDAVPEAVPRTRGPPPGPVVTSATPPRTAKAWYEKRSIDEVSGYVSGRWVLLDVVPPPGNFSDVPTNACRPAGWDYVLPDGRNVTDKSEYIQHQITDGAGRVHPVWLWPTYRSDMVAAHS